MEAAIDISTGYGFDSFFADGSGDPWQTHCLIRLIDVAVNHHSIGIPLPTFDAIELRSAETVPASVHSTLR